MAAITLAVFFSVTSYEVYDSVRAEPDLKEPSCSELGWFVCPAFVNTEKTLFEVEQKVPSDVPMLELLATPLAR